MTTGTTDFTIKSGLRTPIVAIPIPLLAVPYAAPMSTEKGKLLQLRMAIQDYQIY